MYILRKLFYLIAAGIIFSITCSLVVPGDNWAPILVYRSMHGIWVNYLTIKIKEGEFDLYNPMGLCTTVGKWDVTQDTLTLYPQFMYIADKDSIEMETFGSTVHYCIPNTTRLTIFSKPMKFIIRERWNKLLEIDDSAMDSIYNNIYRGKAEIRLFDWEIMNTDI